MRTALPLEAGVKLAYRINDNTDPWAPPAETIMLVHGLAESADAWYGWMPHLTRDYRVVRPDLRGFGASTPMKTDFAWSLDLLADDLATLINHIGGPVHLVGAKIGATISTRLAARHPALLQSLTVIGLPLVGSKNRPGLNPKEHGVRVWARSSMEERLGETASPEMLEWWSDLMGKTHLSTLTGFSDAVGAFDVREDLKKIACPVLVITSDSPRHPLAEAEAWRKNLRKSEIVAIPGEGYHASAVHPDLCAKSVLDFVKRHHA